MLIFQVTWGSGEDKRQANMYQLERAPLYARTLHNSRLLFQYGQSQGLHMLGSRNFSAISGPAVHPVTFKRSGYDLIQTNKKQESWHHGVCQIPSSRGLHSWNFYASKYLSPDFPPIGYAQKFLETVHETTGLPWWAAIILTSFTVRTVVTLPLSVYSVHILARVQNLAPEIEGIAQELKVEVMDATKRMKWDEKMAKYQYRINVSCKLKSALVLQYRITECKSAWNLFPLSTAQVYHELYCTGMYILQLYRLIKELYIRDNCHPFKASLVAWIQFPMWISISLALRNMSGSLHIPGAGDTFLPSRYCLTLYCWHC